MYGATNSTRIASRRQKRAPPMDGRAELQRSLLPISVHLLDTARDVDHARHDRRGQTVILAVVAKAGVNQMAEREVTQLSAALPLVVHHLHMWQREYPPSGFSRPEAPIELFCV